MHETKALIARLDLALAACYEEHPHLGEIPKAGTGRRIRKIKRVKDKARRRLNYHLHAAGYPLTIQGAMMFINQADSGYF